MPTATPFNNLITFSRGSNATLTGSNGLIQWAPSNFLTFSEQFDNAAWSKIATTVTANTSVAPDGTATADTLVGDGTSAAHQVRLSVVASGAFQHVLSVYLKQGTERYGYLYTLGRNATDDKSDFCFFDLQTGTITQTNASGAGATISAVGNGWYRVTMPTGNYPSSINIEARIGITNTLNQQTSTASGNFLVWGAQLEIGSTATTYNPTTVKNLLGFSEAFDNAAWNKVAAAIVAGAQANPVNGLFNAQKLMEGTATTRKTVAGPSVGSTNQTFSVYVKPAGRNFVAIGQTNGSGLWAVSLFNLSTGAFTASYQAGALATPTVNQITSVGNGWFRVSCLFNAGGSAPQPVIMLGNGGDPIFEGYTGDGNSGVYIYGAQLSDSASLDPYVPTPGAAPSSTAFYGPRFDFDPVTLQPRGLLVEEQRTNSFTQSGAIGTGLWGNTGAAAITQNATTAPDGTTTAARLSTTAASSSFGWFQNFTYLATAYTLSCYFKAGTYSLVTLDFTNTGATAAAFNLATGAVIATSGGATATITLTRDGWYRCAITATLAAGAGFPELYLNGSPSAISRGPWAGTGAENAFVWGAQLEAGAFATSYIPTVASTVTRSADVATITGQNFAQWYRQDEGAIAVDFVSPVAGDRTAVNPSDGTNNNRMTIGFTASSPNNLAVFTGGALQALIGAGTQTPGAVSKMASAYRLNDFASTTNGAVPGTDTSGTVPTVNQLNIASLAIGGALNGHIRSINYVPARAADFQLQALST